MSTAQANASPTLDALTKVLVEVRNGANRYIRWSPLFKNFIITDGVQEAMEAAQSYWLLDILATELAPRINDDLAAGNIATVNIMVKQSQTRACTIVASTFEQPEYWRKEIPHSTFPMGDWRILTIGCLDWNAVTARPNSLVCALHTEN